MNQVKTEYKKRFSLYHQKMIALIAQERKRKYKVKEKPRYKKKIWNEKIKNLVHPFAGREGNSTSSERHFYCSKRWKKCHKRKIAT